MKLRHRMLALAPLLLVLAARATVAKEVAAPLFGIWEERFDNGARMVVEFTPDSISSRPISSGGEQTAPTDTKPVQCEQIARGTEFLTYSLRFKNERGKPEGGAIMLLLRLKTNEIVMIFPGAGSHLLQKPEAI